MGYIAGDHDGKHYISLPHEELRDGMEYLRDSELAGHVSEVAKVTLGDQTYNVKRDDAIRFAKDHGRDLAAGFTEQELERTLLAMTYDPYQDIHATLGAEVAVEICGPLHLPEEDDDDDDTASVSSSDDDETTQTSMPLVVDEDFVEMAICNLGTNPSEEQALAHRLGMALSPKNGERLDVFLNLLPQLQPPHSTALIDTLAGREGAFESYPELDATKLRNDGRRTRYVGDLTAPNHARHSRRQMSRPGSRLRL